jgi:hypothetical protein
LYGGAVEQTQRHAALITRHGGRRPAIHGFSCDTQDVDGEAKPRAWRRHDVEKAD